MHARQGWLVRDNRDNGLGISRRYIECDHRAAAVAKHECRGFTDGLQYGDSVSTLLGNVEMIRMVHRTAATRPTVVDNDFEVCRESLGNCPVVPQVSPALSAFDFGSRSFFDPRLRLFG